MIVEIPEMLGASRADLRKLKAFISRRMTARSGGPMHTTSNPARDGPSLLPLPTTRNRCPTTKPEIADSWPSIFRREVMWSPSWPSIGFNSGLRACRGITMESAQPSSSLFSAQAEANEGHRRAAEGVEKSLCHIHGPP